MTRDDLATLLAILACPGSGGYTLFPHDGRRSYCGFFKRCSRFCSKANPRPAPVKIMATIIRDARVIRRLIRCRKTQRYFDGDGWTFDPNTARSFDHAIDAARACVDNKLESVDLVLQLPEAPAELFSTFLR